MTNESVSYIITERVEATAGYEVWLSLVERCVRDAEVASSNLVTSIWPCSQAAKTPPSHGGDPGSIPGEVITPEDFFRSIFLLQN